MKAGIEMDALIAEKVMGQKLMTFEQEPWHEPYPPTLVGFKRVPQYSTDIAAAWEVVEKIIATKGEGIHNVSLLAENGYWEFIIYDTEQYYGQSEDPAHAICRAALKAVGYTK